MIQFPVVLLFAAVYISCGSVSAQNQSIQFFGNGVSDIDRIKIRLDAPAKPADVSGSFTVEFWMKAKADENNGFVEDRNDGDGWITGNIIIDRDIYGSGDYGDYGISLGTYSGGGMNDRGICFGVDRAGNGRSIVADYNVADDQWHHVAVTRDSVTGAMRIFIDGIIRASGTGPSGNVSYRNNRATSWPLSDPFLVIGAEKHDAGTAYPSYSGKFDELRISRIVRYTSDFTVSPSEFSADQFTAALFHFNEVSGDTVHDISGAAGGPSNGIMKTGGNPSGPLRIFDSPFDLFLDAKILLEGLYDPSADRLNANDTVRIILHNPVPPYSATDSARAILDSVTFSAYFIFPNAPAGSYYIAFRHRNSVETWSASPVVFQNGANAVSSMIDSASSAYGNNLTFKVTRYCIYSGDINADGSVDGTDVLLTDNAAYGYFTGYLPEDLNGDLIADATDISIADNNAYSFISRIIP